MIGKASEFDKVVDGENISEYIVYELTLPGFAAKLRKYARKWYLLWVGLDPLLWILDLTADACHSAGAFFFVHLTNPSIVDPVSVGPGFKHSTRRRS